MYSATLFSMAALWSVVTSIPTQQYNSTVSIQATVSTTTSSGTTCPTLIEEGTYCGFLNPEDPCSPQPGGYGPKMIPDTVSTFRHYKPFQAMALNASTPTGYTSVFKNLTSAAITPDYIGLYLLETYNTTTCANKCDEISGCNSFDIYVERDPSLSPSKNDSTAPTVWGYWCPNPSSAVNYKCALWGKGIDKSLATNAGEFREDFEVVVAGSNGYVKTAYYNSTVGTHGTVGKNGTTPAWVTSYTGAGARSTWSLWLVLVMGVGLFGL